VGKSRDSNEKSETLNTEVRALINRNTYLEANNVTRLYDLCCDVIWRPVRESNPCRRREREGNHWNSRKLCGMDSTLPFKTACKVVRVYLKTISTRLHCITCITTSLAFILLFDARPRWPPESQRSFGLLKILFHC